jgi:hypothetical protein
VFLHDTYTKYKSYKCSRKFRRKFLTRPFQTRKRIYYYVKGLRTGPILGGENTHTHETRTKEILDEIGDRLETSASNSLLPCFHLHRKQEYLMNKRNRGGKWPNDRGKIK